MGKLNTVNNGKGSNPRPISNYQKFINNWDNIFSKKSLDSGEKLCDTQNYESKNGTRTKKKRLES
jgi:hypothetical protein